MVKPKSIDKAFLKFLRDQRVDYKVSPDAAFRAMLAFYREERASGCNVEDDAAAKRWTDERCPSTQHERRRFPNHEVSRVLEATASTRCPSWTSRRTAEHARSVSQSRFEPQGRTSCHSYSAGESQVFSA